MIAVFSDLSGTILSGYMSTLIKVVMYAAVAAAGIAIGIKLSKNKSAKKNKEA